MEIVLAALVAAGVAVAVVMLVQRPRTVQAGPSVVATPEPAPAPAEARPAARRDALEEELLARRTELARLEERLRAKDSSLELQSHELDDRERSLEDRRRNLDHTREELKTEKARQLRELERVSGLSAGQAKQIMMRELEDDLRHESARIIRQVEEETRHDADRRARSILAAVMQRVASSHAVETTVSVVELKSDELKGRIIGREGRNIRALETLTGIDFIIDDTPGAVLLSGFDGVRREIARLTLERLLTDGRIHPARIEEAFHQAKSEIDQHVVELKSDELKGRIIGREGRNIRALETLTGIDFIIDDTPGAVLLSGFDGVRREIARLTLERLLTDGRIHPARIEEAFHQAKSEIDQHVVEVGEQAVFEANVGSLHPELVKLLGRLKFRTSYGQNVLHHSIECARLAGMLAAELGADPRVAARAALLHDIGKAVSHETDGPHALVGGELARRYKESEGVAHAMEAHHNEVELQTVEAVIVQVVDALSGARPGARGESLEQYVKRLHELEAIACRHTGVDKVYAMHAGREIRVIVHPEEIDDDAATLLSHQIARDVEKELEYPGQIKVTVIRESRATDYAK